MDLKGISGKLCYSIEEDSKEKDSKEYITTFIFRKTVSLVKKCRNRDYLRDFGVWVNFYISYLFKKIFLRLVDLGNIHMMLYIEKMNLNLR